MKFLEELNSEQRRAAEILEGSALIMAGAGTGKTKTVISRVGNLILNGVVPSSILVLTFTNKAGAEMKERIALIYEELPREIFEDYTKPFIGTFHSFGQTFLRKYTRLIKGINEKFTLADNIIAKGVIRNLLKKHSYLSEKFTPALILDYFSFYKNNLRWRKTLDGKALLDFDKDQLNIIYNEYTDTLREGNMLDLDDLQYITYKILNSSEDIRKAESQKFQYVMVDEFQDTNQVQYEIIKLLSKRNGNIFVVGDDDQAIYGWRGSKSEFIINFDKEFKDTTVVSLVENYRSKDEILELSNNLISKNKIRREKKLRGNRGKGADIRYQRFNRGDLEAMEVTKQISRLLDSGEEAKDIAVLYRVNKLSFEVEKNMLDNNIPYSIRGKGSIMSRKEVKLFFNYLQFVNEPSNDVALLEILLSRKGIGESTLNRLKTSAYSRGVPVFDLLLKMSDRDFIENFRKNIADSLIQIKHLLIDLLEVYKLSKEHFAQVFESVVGLQNSYLESANKSQSKEFKQTELGRVELLGMIYNDMAEHIIDEDGTITSFIIRYQLDGSFHNPEDRDKVSLMTVHLSKGLEFKYVFIIGFDTEIMPIIPTEEERRLAYVALTRAKDGLFISSAKTRFMYGTVTSHSESLFLKESKLKSFIKDNNSLVIKSEQKSLFDEEEDETLVQHRIFGIGRVKNVLGSPERRYLSVDFDGNIQLIAETSINYL